MEKPQWPTTEGLPITSAYGWRTHPKTGLPDFHSAIDIGGGGVNHPIYATQSGRVIRVQYNAGGWGNYIVLEHIGDEYYSLYAHLRDLPSIPVGTEVPKGQIIGTMGTTGSSTGIHLHFEVATSSSGFNSESGTINPLDYLDMEFEGGDPIDPWVPPGEFDFKILLGRRFIPRRR